MKTYKNAKIDGVLTDIRTEDGKITGIGSFPEAGVDLKGLSVFPGLIDIHAHGCAGYDTMDGNHISEMSAFWAQHGTTSWLPTTMTMNDEAIKAVTNQPIAKTGTANVLGFHLEGPYICMKYKGAQNPKYVRKPDLEEFRTYQNVRMITLAPDAEGAIGFIRDCGVKVAMGHTDADYDCAIRAIEAGADCLTHTFNAMPPLHHRKPGVIGAGIAKGIYAQVICDGMHLHPSVVWMLYKTFGVERMILISDALLATGVADGEYTSGELAIVVQDGLARLKDGTIAGSSSTLLDCVRKAVSFGIPLADAMRMASRTPAEYLGISKGRLEVGYDADFIALDESLALKTCVIGGNLIEGV